MNSSAWCSKWSKNIQETERKNKSQEPNIWFARQLKIIRLEKIIIFSIDLICMISSLNRTLPHDNASTLKEIMTMMIV